MKPFAQANPPLMEETVQTTRQEPEPKSPTCPRASSIEPKVEGLQRISPAMRLRKRQIGSDSNSDDNEHQPKRARLTQKNLALFNKMGRKRGPNGASVFAPTNESDTAKTTSTTSSGFAIQAYENGILHPFSSKPPENLEDIRKRYAQSRRTASPTESAYKDYVDKVGGASNEATMVFEVGGKLLKEYPMEGYQRTFNQAFTGFPKDVGLNNGLSAPQPDFIEGPRMQEFRPFPIHKHINGAVLCKDNPRSVTLSHLAGEWKGPGKDMAEASLQARYDGAALVYTRNKALAYLGKSDPPGHAEITTFTTDGTTLNLYTHYSALSDDGTLEYHQYPIKSTSLVDSHQGFKDGRRGLRNEQDHARDQSYALRDQLKKHWKQHRGGLPPTAEGAPLPVADETYADEGNYNVVEQPCQPTPAASSQPHRASGSVSSSKSLPLANDYAPSSGGHKRKASSPSHVPSRRRSEAKDYWMLDDESGQYFHKHSDGRVTWLEDSDDGN